MGSRKRKVGILVYEGFDPIDVAGPYDTFATAVDGDERLYELHTFGKQKGVVHGKLGLGVEVTHDLRSEQQLDILVVPGAEGDVIEKMREDEEVIAWIKKRAPAVEILFSVCTGAGLVAKAGLLDGIASTTHWAYVQALRELTPRAVILDDVRFADAGHVVSSAGISSSIDAALHLVNRLNGVKIATSTARILQYHWRNSEAETPA